MGRKKANGVGRAEVEAYQMSLGDEVEQAEVETAEVQVVGRDEVETAEVSTSEKQGVGRPKLKRKGIKKPGGGSQHVFDDSHPEDYIHPPVPMNGGTVAPIMAGPLMGDSKNTAYSNFAIEVGALPWPDYNDPESILSNVRRYFELSAKYDGKPGAAGLALALKMDRRRLWEIVNDQPRQLKMPQTSKDAICFAYQHLNFIWEQWMQNGQINPASGIFLGINNFSYHNEQNIIVQPAVSASGGNVEEIQRKYAEIPADVEG